VRRVARKADSEPAVAAAELEHALTESPERRKMGAFRVEDRGHAALPGLYAFTVVPRAPYFSALRLVSSNAERA
jgi:hypothetical protein